MDVCCFRDTQAINSLQNKFESAFALGNFNLSLLIDFSATVLEMRNCDCFNLS